MVEIDKTISNLVKHQFPAFYQSEGETFIAFVQAYYEWMEQNGYTINASKSLLEYSDIDTTLDLFLANFKNEFLVNFPSITAANKRFMVKHIKDFYQSKGSIRGMQLLFRLLFDDDIEVYNPGTDILKASDGIWKVPNYIEVEHTERSRSYINKIVTGSISGATAFAESVYSKVVNQRIIDVIVLSGIQGKFIYGEIVTDDGNFLDAPKVIGSLTEIDIVDGGANSKIGDVYDITSSTSGKGGKARVSKVEDGTGRVLFNLLDGGTGYTNASSQVKVSNVVFNIANKSNSNNYIIYENVTQPLVRINYSVTSPAVINVNSLYQTNVYGYSGATLVANGWVASINSTASNTFVIITTSGNFYSATDIKTESNAIAFSAYTTTNVTATGIVTGSNSNYLGLHNINNTFYGNGAFVTSSNSLITANITSVSSGSGASFGIGAITDTETLFLFTDFLGGNNFNNIPYLNMIISGGNSNTGLLNGTGSITCSTATNAVTGTGTSFNTQLIVGSGLYTSANVFLGVVDSIGGATTLTLAANSLGTLSTAAFKYNLLQYGFPKNVSVGYNNIISDALATSSFEIGTIVSLAAVNPGSNYNVNPFVLLRNDYIAGFQRKNIFVELSNRVGSFSVGDSLTQTVSTPTITIGFNANTGAFNQGEGITQSNGISNSYATIGTLNTLTSTMILTDIIGNIVANSSGGLIIRGLSSNATANVTIASGTTQLNIARGTVVDLPNSSVIEIKRKSFNTNFTPGSILISSSGGSANIVSSYSNPISLEMGNNALVSANVSTAKGIATKLQIINSGVGHQPGDAIELTNDNNIFAISGIANVYNQGTGDGYWVNTQGMLNSDKYIIDGEYYQSFSYEIQTRLSLNKYSNILRQLAHVVGTKMFGKVLINSQTLNPLVPISSDFESSYVIDRSGLNILDRTENNIITINRNYTISRYETSAVIDRNENFMVDSTDQLILLRY